MVLESRQDDREDVRLIERVRSTQPRLVFEQRRPNEEPLLWVADAVTWAAGTGGEWRELIELIFGDDVDTAP